MTIDKLKEKIEHTLLKAQTYPDRARPRIEYNIELPEDMEGITEDDWRGYRATRNTSMTKGNINLLYSL